jgi:SAM-dependent methyltransferase
MTITTSEHDLAGYVRLAEELLGLDPATGQDAIPAPGMDDVRGFYTTGAASVVSDHSGPVRSLHVPLAGSGVDTQPDLVDRIISAAPPGIGPVVELGCGEGFNTLHLARAHPEVSFLGLDLLPTHVATAEADGGPVGNARFAAADYHHLPLAPASVGLIFTVESICHSPDMPRVLSQVRDALRPGGQLFVIEQFRTHGFDGLAAHDRHACAVAERLLAFPPLWTLPEWITLARRTGLEVTEATDLSPAALPMLTRAARLGRRLLSRPGTVPGAELKSLLSAVLVCGTLQLGGHGIYAIRMVRPGRPTAQAIQDRSSL